MSSYAERLHATKEFCPFERWLERGEELEQYTEEVCREAQAIVDRMIDRLVAAGETAAESTKLTAFQEAVEAFNALDEENANMLIETQEREELCEMFNVIAVAAGLDPKKYGGGEGPASVWRDW